MVDRAPVVLILTDSGHETATRISLALGNIEIHGQVQRTSGCTVTFDRAITHIQKLFTAGHPIIGLCASGILIRAVSPLLEDKSTEPPVLAVAEDGSAVVPLLGGHHGANDLARKIADILKIDPAITTAGDLQFGLALDSPPEGWVLANPQHAKPVMAALLGGAKARIDGQIPWSESVKLPIDPDGDVWLIGTDTNMPGDETALVYHPKTLALGVGCERNCDLSELITLTEQTLKDNNLSPLSIAVVVSVDIKQDENAVLELARHLGVPARFFSKDELAREADRLANPSKIVQAEIGIPGVAEAAALAAAGRTGKLIVEKQKSKRATCAIARSDEFIDIKAAGRARGRLAIVGLGPGTSGWCTPEATQHLADATDWVGYSLYLDLAGQIAGHQTRHDFDLGEEEARVRHALDLAAAGKHVALICSGDPGIYAMASLVFEAIDKAAQPYRAEIVVIPGISALQAAAARTGAPLGHDFCAISLSDLLTPWEVIEQRIKAAAQGDFVVAFYNPKSKRRDWQLERARDLLLEYRAAETPIVLASNLGRPTEQIIHKTLGGLVADDADMLTLIIVGSSETRRVAQPTGAAKIYTPRGYRVTPAKRAAE